MSWKNPRKVTKNILLYFSILSLFAAVFWLSIFYIWNNHPQMVSDYDNSIPNHYTNRITRLQTRTYKGKTPEDTYKRHQILAEALQGATRLHKYYDLFSDTQKFMIDYLLKENRLIEAEQLANKWQRKYPYDFNAKFKYADVLSFIDKNKEKEYYASVYKKHKDIFELNKKYIALLLEQGLFEKALAIALYSRTQNREKSYVDFMYYYADEINKKYNAKTKTFKDRHLKIGNNHTVSASMNPSGLKKIRFDIDRVPVLSKIKDMSFTIKTDDKIYDNIKALPLHHLELKDETFKTIGTDPYVNLSLPDEIIGLQGNMEISAFLNIEEAMRYVLQTITHHPELQFSCSEINEFKQENTYRFLLKRIFDKYQSENSIEEKPCQYLKINLPSLLNFSFSELNIKMAGITLTEKNIQTVHALEKNSENSYKVKDEKPYIIFKSDQPLLTHDIEVNMNIGKQQ